MTEATATNELERELWRGTYSTKALAATYILTTIVFVVGTVLSFLCPVAWWWRAVLAMLSGLPLLYCFCLGQYRKFTIKYVLTSQRIVCESGLLNLNASRVGLVIVDDVGWKQIGLDRVFGIGTITITSHDPSDPVLTLAGVDNVRNVAQQIEAATAVERKAKEKHA